VRELIFIVLAVMELVCAASMKTFEAAITILPEVVSKRPEVVVIVLVASRFRKKREPVEIVPPALSMNAFGASMVVVFATKLLVRVISARVNEFVANVLAANVSTYKKPVLTLLVTTVLIFRYPPEGAKIFPERRIVDAWRDEVCSCVVDRVLKTPVFATRLETLRLPLGLVMMVEPS
jgi:hypothetical protein